MLLLPSGRVRATRPASRSLSARNAVLLIGSVLVAMLVVCSCSGVASRSATPTEPGATSPPLDRLTIATSFAIENLDPLENGFWAPEFGFGALLMKPVGGGRLDPWLLESTTQASPTTWTLTLRPNLHFQDGRALDAAALAEAMSFSLAENDSVKPLLPGATVAATGPSTVVLTTTKPTAYVPSLLAHESMFPVFDVAAYQAHKGKPDELIAAKIWAGPYTVTSLSSEAMELEPTAGFALSTPKLTHLTLRFIPDAQARILAVRNGEADLALYPPSSTARELEGRSDARYLNQPAGTGTEGFQLLLNIRTGPLADVAVRHAIRDGIDYRQLSQQVLNGLYDTAVGLYPAFLSYAEHNQNTDATKASSELDAAGWTKGNDGVRTKAGVRLSLDLLTYPQQPDSQTIAVALQSQLKAIGIDAAIKQVDDITASVKELTGWSAAVMGNGMLDWTGTDAVAPLIANFSPTGDNNYGGVDDPELTALIEQLTGTYDTATRDELMRQVQKLVVDDQTYTLYLALKRVPVVAAPKLAGYRVPPVALLFVNDYE